MVNAAKKRQQNERRANASETPLAPSSKEHGSPSSTSEVSSLKSPRPDVSPPSRMDGNRDPPPRSETGGATVYSTQGPTTISNKNLDLGGFGAGLMAGLGRGLKLPDRPAQTNKTGREVSVRLNTFNVQSYPSKPIYQYDVLIGSGTEKRGLIKTCWNASDFQNAIGPGWIFDGNKIAWSMTKLDGEKRIQIDTDKAKGRTQRPGQEARETIKCYIRFAKTVNFAPLRGYLARQNDFDISCLESINFMDHLLRETPSQKYTVQKRNFFARGNHRTLLGGGVEAMKGVYASMRLAHPGLLSVNVDVANTTFWTETQLNRTAMQILRTTDPEANLINTIKAGAGKDTWALVELNRLLGHKRVDIYTMYVKNQSKEEAKKNPFRIDKILNQSARQHMLRRVKISDESAEQDMSVYDFFLKKHGIRLVCPDLPVVQMTKMIRGRPIILPMEVCFVKDNQRFHLKLNDKQTSEMIKFAVTLPDQRWKHIQEGLEMLDWGTDRYLNNYGLKINTTPVVAKARVLPNPKVQFGAGSGPPSDPRTSGRWDLRGKKFFEPFKPTLKSWGFCICPGRGQVSQEQVKNFARVFAGVLEQHGCAVETKTPVVMTGNADNGANVTDLRKLVGNTYNMAPQILFFVVPDKNAVEYKRLKKSAECRWGLVSQVVQSVHVQKAQPQYCSNVAMKVNAKLGGTTSRAVNAKGGLPGYWFKVPTMIIGADVSHGAPGAKDEEAASIAALTMSFDRHGAKYIAQVDTNGHRVEMIMKENIDTHLGQMVRGWMTDVSAGKMPQHVIYVRDGVSEGQYAQVLNQEIRDIQELFATINSQQAREIKYTIIMGSKRHHVRFFPEGGSGDRNNNPLPGTLVETAVTHPREFDFYLCAHSAIKGTARPVHYHVLRDDMNMSADALQNMLYESSYQYMRSTTPVSLFPAAYYAHLAAFRGVAHLDKPAVSSGKEESQAQTRSSATVEVKKALPLLKGSNIWKVMWYI